MNRLLTAFAAVLALNASAAPYRQIHRVFCTHAEAIEAARTNWPNAFGTGLIISAFSQIRGPAGVSDFGNCRDFLELFRSRGVDMQVCVGTTIGHSDRLTRPADYPKMVGTDGKAARAVACPRAPAFLAHLREVYARYAALKPSVVWIDDDLRMIYHPPVDYGCFCADCLRRFGEETGMRFDRKGLVRALKAGEASDGRSVRTAWRDYNVRALNEVVRAVAEAVHGVDPAISVGIMFCNYNNPRGGFYAPPDYKTWIDLCTASGAKVWFRHGSGCYRDYTPYDDRNGLIAKNIQIARACAATEGERVVNLTEEVTAPYIRRTKSMRMTFLEAVLNVGMAGAEGTTYDAVKPNLDEQLKPNAVVAEMHRRYPELDRMLALIRGKRQLGLYPNRLPDPWLKKGKVEKLIELCDPGEERWRNLIYLGIPITFRLADAAVVVENRWKDPKVRRKGAKTGEPLAAEWLKALSWAGGEAVKDQLDRIAGGRMPSRADSAVRVGQSVWESPDGTERTVFVYNFDFDDADDVRLTEDGTFSAEVLGADGSWTPLGTGDVFAVPTVPAWSAKVLRLRRNANQGKGK